MKGTINTTEIYIKPTYLILTRKIRANDDNNMLTRISFLLEYTELVDGSSTHLTRIIKNALKQGDQCILPVNIDSILVQQIYPGI